ncbi:MAG: TetR/AcrR family transcriptional regulator [Pseudomonadota bacterium]
MPRKTREDWLHHGLKTLKASGFEALKAAPMADSLGVSRGSFYWHFKDLSDFHTQLIDLWQERTTDRIIVELTNDEAPQIRLRTLVERAVQSDAQAALDRAVRRWADQAPTVRARLALVDEKRIGFIADLISAARGHDRAASLTRARILYAASIGESMIAGPAGTKLTADQRSALVDLILA